MGQEFEVEAGAASDDGGLSSVLDFLDDGQGQLSVTPGIHELGGGQYAIKVVRNCGEILLAWCGGNDLQAAVELESVGGWKDFALGCLVEFLETAIESAVE